MLIKHLLGMLFDPAKVLSRAFALELKSCLALCVLGFILFLLFTYQTLISLISWNFTNLQSKFSVWILLFLQCKQTLHHFSAVEFGANFQTYPLPHLKKPLTSPHTIHNEWMCGGFYYKFARVNFALWRQVFKISDLTFGDSFGSASIMCVFSVRQTSQNFAPAKKNSDILKQWNKILIIHITL